MRAFWAVFRHGGLSAALLYEPKGTQPRGKRLHAKTRVVLVPDLIDVDHASNVEAVVIVEQANTR